MKKVNELTPDIVIKTIRDILSLDLSDEKKLDEIKRIWNDDYCVICGSVYYNCVCGHVD